MGNSQSQMTDKEDDNDDNPRYNYHESVLRDAEADPNNSHTSDSDDANHQDEYHSADETGGVENAANNSERGDDNIADDRRDLSPEEDNLNVALNSPRLTEKQLGTSGNQGDLHTTQSVQDCRADGSDQFDSRCCTRGSGSEIADMRSSNSGNHLASALDLPLSNRKATTLRAIESRRINNSESGQITPVPMSGSLQNAPVESCESVVYLGKRRMLHDLSVEEVLPTKKILIRNSSKRKWLGCSESSHSELSETEEEVGRKLNKNRRVILQSPKKNRRKDRDSRGSDSDEKRYGKQKYLLKSKCCCDSKTADSNGEEGSSNKRKYRYQKHIPGGSRRRREDSSGDSSDFSDETLRYQKRYRCKKSGCNDSDSDRGDNMNVRKIHTSVSKNNNRKVENLTCDQGCQTHQTVVNVTASGGDQDMAQTKTLPHDAIRAMNVTDRSSEPCCHTLKMGSLSWRNSLGKVFPLKQQDTSLSTFNACRDAPSGTDARNSSTIHDLGHSLDTDSSVMKMNPVLLAEKQPQFYDYAERLHAQTNSRNPDTKHCHDSPFKNVVLTPSGLHARLDTWPGLSAANTKVAYHNANDSSSDMEVDQSDMTTETQTTNQFVPSGQFNTMSAGQSSYRKKAVAVRFRNFWLEKKKNIGQNLKSLFSKPNPSLEIVQASISNMWQTFSAKNHAHMTLNNSQSGRGDSSSSSLIYPFMNTTSHRADTFCQHVSISPNSTSQSLQTRVTSLPIDITTNVTKQPSEILASSDLSLAQLPWVTGSLIEWLPPTGECQILNCRLADAVDVSIIAGNLADQKTAAIVNWTDDALTHTVTSCSRNIAAKAGVMMREACDDYINTQGGRLDTSCMLTTPAGGTLDRAVETIIHVTGPSRFSVDGEHNKHALMETFVNCLQTAKAHGRLKSISVPLIGDGIFPFLTCVQSFLDAILLFLTELPKLGCQFHVHLIIPDVAAARKASNYVRSYLECLSCGHADSITTHRLPADCTVREHHLGRSGHLPAAQSFTVERTDSGRPRLKRPRL